MAQSDDFEGFQFGHGGRVVDGQGITFFQVLTRMGVAITLDGIGVSAFLALGFQLGTHL